MKRNVASLMLTAALVLGLTVHALADGTVHELEPSTEPVHVRVLFKHNPANEAVVAWTTTAEGESHTLHVDTEPRDGDLDAYRWQLPSIHSAPYTLRADEADAGMHAWSHNVLLEDLEPATRYYLTAVSDGEPSEEFYFVTAPDDDRTIKLLLVGDSRVGGARTHPDSNRRRVNALLRELMEDRPNVVALCHGGDYTNSPVWSQYYWWLKDHAEMTTGSDGRLLPIIPVQGNHDTGVPFEEVFWWPDRQNPYYYTTQVGSQVAVVTLNTTISRGGDQRDWLEAELQRLRPNNRWIMAQYHHPLWPSARSVASGSAQREAWGPLFERYTIDLGYESHDHILKRTYPIYDNQVDRERGVVYIGDGGGGVSQRRPEISRWYIEVADRYHHAHIIRFGADRLDGAAVDFDQNIVDQFTFLHDRRDRGSADGE